MLLLETIKLIDGIAQNMDYHNERMNNSRNELMCTHKDIYLEDYLNIPLEYRKGIVKCSIYYGMDFNKINFTHYKARAFSRFILLPTQINYDHKFSNRSAFEELQSEYDSSSCLILVKNNLITDTTFSNLIFQDEKGNWFTPEKPLLLGTQREFLLDEGLIGEANIHLGNLKHYQRFMLINAMLEFDESRAFDINLIEKQQ